MVRFVGSARNRRWAGFWEYGKVEFHHGGGRKEGEDKKKQLLAQVGARDCCRPSPHTPASGHAVAAATQARQRGKGGGSNTAQEEFLLPPPACRQQQQPREERGNETKGGTRSATGD